VTVPAIRLRMVSSLLNVSPELASAVAEGLGLELPEPMPRATDSPGTPEIEESAALSLMARPGDGGIATRKVAVMIGDGVDSASIDVIQAALTKAGAVTRFLGVRLGTVTGADGSSIEADATLENSPAVLFDGLVLPDGLESLAKVGQAVEFVKDQFRHCKTIAVLGASSALLEKAGIAMDKPDPGLILADSSASAAKMFMTALAQHRHVQRDQDPPSV
jgi:catalase